ncbi:MAG TPA: AMP-dependent synthetase [Lachnospiraceae bacterium]|nr:AMP-dependent synthetase [Lachnospiraceae bacterium]HBW54995.1 AMP-dependent synthetase [Lachnospiraceae bacterium]
MWNFEQFKNNVAIIDEYGTDVSYEDLIEFGDKVASVISERSLVFVMCTNSIGSVAGYASFVNKGMVSVLLNAHLEKELLDNLVETYKPEYIWVPTEMCTEYEKYNAQNVFSEYGYTLLKTTFDANYELYDELCIMLTTSGSTGSPKFVRQSYKNVESNAKSIVQYLELNSSERPITTLPMNYTYGLSIINSHFMVGATLLVTDKGLMQKEFWKFFKGAEATSFGGVPYTYEMLERLRFFKMELPSLRYMTQAGGKLTPELHKKFAEYAGQKNVKFIVMYGQCEATARMGYLPAEKSLEKYGSMGIAIPGGKFKLIDVNGNDITEPHVTGELVYYGPNVTLGYAECGQDLIKGDERFGELCTGDMAQFDEDGYYYIVGRKKRFLKIYGNRVNLDEVDRMIKTKFDNIDVASAGIDDHMYIFVTEERYANDVVKFVVEKTGLNPAAFQSIVIDSIPKNDAGKTLYKELTKYYK